MCRLRAAEPSRWRLCLLYHGRKCVLKAIRGRERLCREFICVATRAINVLHGVGGDGIDTELHISGEYGCLVMLEGN